MRPYWSRLINSGFEPENKGPAAADDLVADGPKPTVGHVVAEHGICAGVMPALASSASADRPHLTANVR